MVTCWKYPVVMLSQFLYNLCEYSIVKYILLLYGPVHATYILIMLHFVSKNIDKGIVVVSSLIAITIATGVYNKWTMDFTDHTFKYYH